MSGLDKIIADIGENAQNQSKEIIEQATLKAKAYLEAEKKKAEAECDTILLRAKKQSAVTDSMTASNGEMLLKREVLASKVLIIDETIKEAVETILSYGDNEYFDAVKAVVLNNAQKGKGFIRFNKKDKERLPDGFIDALNKALGDEYSLELCSGVADIRGGCILIYGEIEENCSFDSIVSAVKDELRDEISTILF